MRCSVTSSSFHVPTEKTWTLRFWPKAASVNVHHLLGQRSSGTDEFADVRHLRHEPPRGQLATEWVAAPHTLYEPYGTSNPVAYFIDWVATTP